MKRALTIIGRISALILAVLLIVLFVVLPSTSDWLEYHNISEALTAARSVRIVEFTRIPDASSDTLEREAILQSIAASPEQIAQFRSAIGRCVSVGVPFAHTRCWNPHHRIEIIRRDGSPSRVEICFECENIKLTPGHLFTIPPRWRGPLREFFTAIGMAPRSREQYEQLGRSN